MVIAVKEYATEKKIETVKQSIWTCIEMDNL